MYFGGISFWRAFVFGRPGDVETRASLSIGDPALAEYFGLNGTTLAGTRVDETTAVGLTAVYRSVAIIAGTIAGLPLRSLRTLPDGSRERVPTFLDNPAGPGTDMTRFEWVELVMAHLLLHGNCFLQHIYNGAGALVGLWPIHPSAVTVRPIQNEEELANYGGPAGVWRKYFEVSLADGSTRTATAAELTHIPALGTDGVRGLSPIEAHRQALGTGMAGDRAAARLFGSGLLLGGLVSADEELTAEEAREAAEGLRARMTGTDHAGDIVFLNRSLKFTPWTVPPVDAQFIESRNYGIEDVARIYGVPPHLLGLTEKQTSWGTGVAEQNRGLARYTLMAWTSRVEERLSRLLTRPTMAEFDYAGLLQPSAETEIPLLIAQVQAGLLTVDEARRIRNLGPLPSGTATSPPPDGAGRDEVGVAP